VNVMIRAIRTLLTLSRALGTVQDHAMALGDLISIDDRTVLVLGQELDVEKNQPDAGNALLHRVGGTLFVVDTGVTSAFRDALTKAADRLAPWTDVVLLTSHGHPDHVGNNDVVDEWARKRHVPVRHYLPAADVGQMRDVQDYWTASFSRIVGAVKLPAPPALVGWKIASLFVPLNPFGRTTRTYEELPLERIDIGTQRFTGWTFADGAVQVIRSQGHCAGHVVIRFRDAGLLHLADEPNGAVGVMHDADQLKLTTAITAALRMVEDGEVAKITDGHTFEVRDADAARAELGQLLDQYLQLQNGAVEQLSGTGPVDVASFTDGYSGTVERLGIGGANPNPMFTGMMAVNTLRGFGLTPSGSTWHRPDLSAPKPSAQAKAAKMVAAVASTVPWLARRRTKA
jgi:glyoxylase-like metal-dependent hydrolase (beta-lactamase superfamily II)